MQSENQIKYWQLASAPSIQHLYLTPANTTIKELQCSYLYHCIRSTMGHFIIKSWVHAYIFPLQLYNNNDDRMVNCTIA